METFDKRISLTHRLISLILGLILGACFVLALQVWIVENSGPEILLTGPISFLVSSAAYLIALLLVIFRKTSSRRNFLMRIGIFFSIIAICSFCFLALSRMLYEVPIFRIRNAPISIFEVTTLEHKLGFKPLLPSEQLLSYKPSWKEVQKDELTLFFGNGSHNFYVTQSTDMNSNYSQACKSMQNGVGADFSHEPIVIAGESSEIYYPTIENTKVESACVPLDDRVIYFSGTNRVVNIERIMTWLAKFR